MRQGLCLQPICITVVPHALACGSCSAQALFHVKQCVIALQELLEVDWRGDFVGLGLDEEVPKFLRTNAKIKNRHMSKVGHDTALLDLLAHQQSGCCTAFCLNPEGCLMDTGLFYELYCVAIDIGTSSIQYVQNWPLTFHMEVKGSSPRQAESLPLSFISLGAGTAWQAISQ